MYLDAAKKQEIFEKYGKSNTDTGSAGNFTPLEPVFLTVFTHPLAGLLIIFETAFTETAKHALQELAPNPNTADVYKRQRLRCTTPLGLPATPQRQNQNIRVSYYDG